MKLVLSHAKHVLFKTTLQFVNLVKIIRIEFTIQLIVDVAKGLLKLGEQFVLRFLSLSHKESQNKVCFQLLVELLEVQLVVLLAFYVFAFLGKEISFRFIKIREEEMFLIVKELNKWIKVLQNQQIKRNVDWKKARNTNFNRMKYAQFALMRSVFSWHSVDTTFIQIVSIVGWKIRKLVQIVTRKLIQKKLWNGA